MLDFIESPYVLAVSTIVGALLLLLLLTFASNGSTEDGKGNQRFVLPCMINPATLDSEDEDEPLPAEDLSKVKGEVKIQKEPNDPKEDGSLSLEKAKDNDGDNVKVKPDIMDIESCLTVSSALEAEQMIKSSLSNEELLSEREIQRQQLAAIFELMQTQSEKFGDPSMNDIEDQMKMYRFN